MTASTPPPGTPRPRRWPRVLAWTTALVFLLAGVAGFFLADPLHLSEGLPDVLDKRASVISMVAGPLFGALGVWLQRRPPWAPCLVAAPSAGPTDAAPAPPARRDEAPAGVGKTSLVAEHSHRYQHVGCWNCQADTRAGAGRARRPGRPGHAGGRRAGAAPRP